MHSKFQYAKSIWMLVCQVVTIVLVADLVGTAVQSNRFVDTFPSSSLANTAFVPDDSQGPVLARSGLSGMVQDDLMRMADQCDRVRSVASWNNAFVAKAYIKESVDMDHCLDKVARRMVNLDATRYIETSLASIPSQFKSQILQEFPLLKERVIHKLNTRRVEAFKQRERAKFFLESFPS